MGAGNAGDRYVTGGVNWESYSLEALIAMVAENASAPQLEQLADDWRAAGKEVVDAASLLETSLADLMEYWSGTAAEQARQDVALNAQWIGDLGDTAHDIGDPVQEAAGALKAAQDAMPEIPPAPPTPPAQAADGAQLGLTQGGPLPSAVHGTAAGNESAFAAERQQADLKARAVEAMKRFEGAAITIDETTPKFEERSNELRDPPAGGPKPPLIGWQPPAIDTVTTVSYLTDMELRWLQMTGGDTGTTPQGYDDTGRSGTSGYSGGGGGGGYLGGGGGGARDTGAPARPLGQGMATGLTEAVPGRPGGAPAGAPAAALGGGGGAGAGMGMGGMPMGMGAGAGQGSGAEHRRRYPYDAEDPFAVDQKASPPVIGL